jgi:integrase
VPRINKRTMDAIKPDLDAARVFLWDDRLPGFGVVVRSSGTHSFIFQYRNAERRSRRATIAKVGAITPDQARVIAQGMATKVKHGGDPLADRKTAREALTVSDVLDAYLESARFEEKAPSTQAIDKGRIARHLRPLLAERHVDKLESEDIRRAFTAIRDGKTATTEKTGKRGLARVTGGEGTARSAIRLLRAIFSWAQQERMIANNPATGVSVGTDGERDTVLEGADYTRLFKTLGRMETEKRIRAPVADAIRVIALTGARRGEIAGLRWRYVNLKTGVATLPPGAHKTGRKTGKARVITLPAVAQEIVARQPQGKPDERVFQPSAGQGDINLSKPWRTVREEAELPDGIGLHGLRHSMATLLAMGGAGAAEIMTALGHKQLSSSQKYIHAADTARAALAERAAGPALAGLAAASGVPSVDVVDIAAGAKKGRA